MSKTDRQVDCILNRALSDAKSDIPSEEITATEMMEYLAASNIKDERVVEIIAAVERDAENDAIYCCGGPLAWRIVSALTEAGIKMTRSK